MFTLVRVALRSFVVGFVAGILFAPGPGAETRRRLADGLGRALRGAMSLAALPPVEPRRALTNGQSGPEPRRRKTTTKRDARSS